MPIAIIISLLLFFQSTVQESKPQLLNSNGQNFERYIFGRETTRLSFDQDGRIWIGTTDGVAVFDGYSIRGYQESLLDTSRVGFYGSYVTSILNDSDQNTWVSTGNGTWNLLLSDSTGFINFSDSHDPITITGAMAEDRNGRVWASIPTSLLKFSYDRKTGKKSINSYEAESLGISSINKLVQSSSGNIYVLGIGIYRLENLNDNDPELTKIVEGSDVWQMTEIGEDLFMIADEDQLYVIDEEGMKVKVKGGSFGNELIQTIHKDKRGKFWVATNQGARSFDLNEEYELENVVFYRIGNIREIIEDQSGNLFFASNIGLLKLNWNYTQYQYIQLPEEYENTYVFKYHTDADGNYWIGHNGGLLKYNVESQTFKTIFKDGQVHSLNEDKNHNIWAGSGYWLRIYDYRTGEVLHDFENGHTFEINASGKENIWFINNGKLKRANVNTLEITDFDIGDRVHQVQLDGDLIWVSTDQYDLRKFRVNGDSLQFIQTYLTGILKSEVHWVEDDLIGNLWLSTSRGVVVFNKVSGKISELLNHENKLNDSRVYEIIRDHDGIIWVKAAAFGSTAIDPKTREAISFTPGWLTRPGDTGFYCVNAVDRNGNLFTDGRGGFFVFHPDSISGNEVPPKVILEEVQVNDVMSFSSDLRYDQNDIEFQYTGVQFDAPDRNEFAYYLEGYDQDWNFVKDQRVARYLSLPPGKYTFYVKASNSDGVWSDETQLAAFTIFPPLWKTNFAYLFYLLVLVGISFAFYRTQLNRKLAESEAGRLKELDEFKSRFFTNISHEFRTPLTVISGMANRIHDQSGIVIKRNSQKLLGLINQILELSKLESSTSKLNLIQGDILSYTNYLIQSFSSYAEENEISLNLDSDQEEILIDFDKDKYDLIIQNLLSNAIKFTGKGGVIDLFLTSEKETLMIEISDTGIGIEEKDIPKLFDRFYQVETTHSNNQGSGIGLSLTKELVKLMNGTISVESVVGEGSTFRISLPITRTAIPVEIDDLDDIRVVVGERSGEDLNGESVNEHEDKKDLVLLVEDNEDVRDFVYSVVSKNYAVVTAEDGNEGIRKAKELIPDMIISDVMMPGSDGIELTGTLKKNEATSHIPIILLTAKADIESRLSGLKTGADIYLSKPFNESELLIHLQNLMAQRERIRTKYNQGMEEEKIEDEFILKVNNTILEHLNEEEYGIEEVCKEIGVSRTQLHRKLKALTGKSTSIFIRDIRLNEGRKLLKSTSFNIAEIAYKVGFGDPNYFSKLYSEKYDHSPSKERETVV